MQTYPEIKRFVQETLVCSCPEEVFNKINYQKEIDCFPGRKVNVGDRLLIYIITTDAEFCPLRYHLMLVRYDMDAFSSQDVLRSLTSQDVHARLIGPV